MWSASQLSTGEQQEMKRGDTRGSLEVFTYHGSLSLPSAKMVCKENVGRTVHDQRYSNKYSVFSRSKRRSNIV